MLFMAVYTGTNEANLMQDSEQHAAYHQVLSNASQTGVIMRGVYVTERLVYFLFEAESSEQIAAIFKPMLTFGQLESVPVVDRLAL